MRYYLIAGEASGDLHGAALMRGLAKCDPQAQFRFRGGNAMKAAGGTIFRHYGENAVMGGAEVAAKAGRLLADLRATEKDAADWQPDVLILIDQPAYNLKVARYAHRRGIKVFYYIAPKLWARGERRIRKIRKYVDELFVIFPFEVDYFARLGVTARYFGNPLTGFASPAEDGDDGGSPLVALLPGSRRAELKWMMPRIAALEKLMRSDPEGRWEGYRLVIAGAPDIKPEEYATFLPEDSRIEIRYGKTCDLLREARSAVVCSGTATLEAALADVPQVVCYGFSRITYLLAKMLVKVDLVSLPNIILGREAVRELIQDDSTPENIYAELLRLTFDADYRAAITASCDEIRSMLGAPGAEERAAEEMVRLLT